MRGQTLEGRFEIGDFLQPDRNGGWFRARDLAEERDIFLYLKNEEARGAAEDFDRFREAAFLSHPNLAQVYAAGRARSGEWGFIYLATEAADSGLDEDVRRRPMTVDEAAELFRQLCAGLIYLHSENLTSCAVRAPSIWRVGSQWKLADFSQLRLPGKYPISETRELLLDASFESPPEANEGLVSTAWDVWSLGAVMRKVFPRAGREQFVPPPFDAIVSTALDPDPRARPPLSALLEDLAADRNRASVPVQPPLPVQQSPVQKPPVQQVPVQHVTAQHVAGHQNSAQHVPGQHGPVQQNGFEPPVQPFPPLPPRQPVERAEPERRALREYRTPVLIGGVLAACVAGVLALVMPTTRMVHPQDAEKAASRAPVVSAPAAVPPAPSAAVPPPLITEPQKAQPSGRSPFPSENAGAASGASSGPHVQGISDLLNQWVRAKIHKSAEEEVACYAPVVDTFYGQRGLNVTQLRRQEQNVFSRIGTVDKFDITNLKFDKISPDWAVVSFDKTWEFGGRSHYSGSARDELVLRPVRGRWKISSEREVKVYWVKKQPA